MTASTDVYGMTVTPEERAATKAAADADECSQPACRVRFEKERRGQEERPVWHMCERHQREHMERHTRAMADYREAQRVIAEARNQEAT